MILIGKKQTSTGVEKDKSSAGALGRKGGGRGLPKALQLLRSTLWYLNRTRLNRAATGKKSEGERGQKHFQNNHLLTDTDQQKATEKPNQEIEKKII